ncbi:hypothetical protein [Arthrobacter rhombi]|uniref:Uncharacterized protein n=1 Tax=Arthrobacter rhombi TaxID=71253 RepID=A0A1R4G3N7_9MICC|nr:hypothetical protein [Arthrobacter rhombi]SJM62781.1 hypothetical protein FM101_07470 [Arthrobacter rhombi]
MDNTAFIATNARAHALYTQGWEDGHAQGHRDGLRDAGNAAELAAVRFYTLEATDAHNRAQVADTARSLDVPRFRDRPMPVSTIKPKPSLAQFLDGLRRGGILTDRQGVSA